MAEMATGSSEDALDLVQEAMIAFVGKYADKESDSWRPLFYRVLQNKIRDWYRWSRVRNRWRSWLGNKGDGESESDGIEQIQDQSAREPYELLAGEDELEKALVAATELPMRQQQALVLRQWEGLSVAETAVAMGCSEGSVKTHLSRALNSLRAKVER